MREVLADAGRVVSACVAAPVFGLSDGELVSALVEVHRLESCLAMVKLGLVREVHGRDLGVTQGASTTAVWLRDRLRIPVRDAKRLLNLAVAVDGPLPMLRQALVDGAVTVEQAQVIAAAAIALPAEAGADAPEKAISILVEAAEQLDPSLLRQLGDRILTLVAPDVAEEAERKKLEEQERKARLNRGLTMSPDGNGSVRLRGQLDNEAATIVNAALDPLCAPGRLAPDVPGGHDDRTAAQRRADALVEVCRLALNTGELPEHGGDRPQLVVTVDYDLLKQTLGVGTLDNGQTLSPQTVRRLACDAMILPVVLGGTGQPLDVGRERRLFTGPLRRALVARDGGCAFPSCDRPARWCDGHHILSWLNGGETSLTNAVLLCGRHHRLIHHSDWTIHIGTDGHPWFTPPAWLDPTRTPRRNLYHRRH